MGALVISSGYFDSMDATPGYPPDLREYAAEEFTRPFARFITDGIRNGGNNLLAEPVENALAVRILPGYASLRGRYRDMQEAIVLEAPDVPDTARVDRIVMRLDIENQSIAPLWVVGGDDPPDLVRTETLHDLGLALLHIPAGAQAITRDMMEDTRYDPAVCGICQTLIPTDLSMYDTRAREYIEHMESRDYITDTEWQAIGDGEIVLDDGTQSSAWQLVPESSLIAWFGSTYAGYGSRWYCRWPGTGPDSRIAEDATVIAQPYDDDATLNAVRKVKIWDVETRRDGDGAYLAFIASDKPAGTLRFNALIFRHE